MICKTMSEVRAKKYVTIVSNESLSPFRLALGAHEGANHEIGNSQEKDYQQKYLGLCLPF